MEEEKTLVVNYSSEEDYWGSLRCEEIYGVSEKGTTVAFRAYDLSECPEDAIFGRDLFDSDDFLNAVELGMKLAKEGYTSIKLNHVEEIEEN